MRAPGGEGNSKKSLVDGSLNPESLVKNGANVSFAAASQSARPVASSVVFLLRGKECAG